MMVTRPKTQIYLASRSSRRRELLKQIGVAFEVLIVREHPARGYDVDEFYGEIVVPILKDRAGADSLSFSAAARFSDSSLFESETGTKFSLNWGPTEHLMLRASYSEGFRAPNIGELFSNASVALDGSTDPCTGATPDASAAETPRRGIRRSRSTPPPRSRRGGARAPWP